MSASNLHGSAPDDSAVALLLIDVINDCNFPEAGNLLRYAEPMANRIAELAARAREARVPVIFINDNFGRWRSDFKALVKHCLGVKSQGRRIVELLQPKEQDYFVLKPKHSGFYSTTLDILLAHLGVRAVILTGMAANICVLFTANDAYMRDIDLIVPRDCVASNSQELTNNALDQMQMALKADICLADDLTLARLRGLARPADADAHPKQADNETHSNRKAPWKI